MAVTVQNHKIAIVVLALFFVGIRFVSPVLLEAGSRDVVAAVVAGVALFRIGAGLQRHAVEKLRRFRITGRVLLWFLACVAFWYSTIVLVWWSRRTPTFPFFLLNARLEPNLFFEWVPFFVLGGLLLDGLRVQDRE